MSNATDPTDWGLIQAAQLKATGADIHDVNGVVGYYRAGCECLSRGPESGEQRDLASRMVAEGAAILTAYRGHGDIKRAKRENGWPGPRTTRPPVPPSR